MDSAFRKPGPGGAGACKSRSRPVAKALSAMKLASDACKAAGRGIARMAHLKHYGPDAAFGRAMHRLELESRRSWLLNKKMERAKQRAFAALAAEHPEFSGLPEERMMLKLAALSSKDGIGLCDKDIINAPDDELLFKAWSAKYDPFMMQTGHDRAVGSLLSQLVEANRIFAARDLPQLLHNDLLEASAGTGTVIRLLHEALGNESVRMRFTHNERSGHMQSIAEHGALAQIKKQCSFTNFDIRDLGSGFSADSFGTVLLSQTLHLIVSRKQLEREKDASYPFSDDDTMQHPAEKRKAMEALFRLVRPNGTFVVIDEWPPQFSGEASTPFDAAIDRLFMNVFRPLFGKERLYDIMGAMPGARLVADLKANIDQKHSMSMLVYRKEDCAAGKKPGAMLGKDDALELGIGLFRAMDPFVAGAMNSRFIENGLPQRLFPMEKTGPFRMAPGSIAPPFRKHGCVLVHGMPHGMAEKRRNSLYGRALGTVRPGGSLIIAEDGHPPAGHPRPLFDEHEAYGLYEELKFNSDAGIWPGGMLAIPVREAPGCLYMRQYWK
jgi:ubiquinone/menaquinone biosynthesis C-methylase UbiE